MKRAALALALAVVTGAALWLMRRPAEHAAAQPRDSTTGPRPHHPRELATGDRSRRDRILGALHAIYAAPQPPHRPSVPQREPYLHATLQHELVPVVRACYDDAYARDHAIGGKLVLAMTLVGNAELGGVVESVEPDLGASTVHDPELIDCVTQTMLELTFEGPKDGGYMSLTHPFELVPVN